MRRQGLQGVRRGKMVRTTVPDRHGDFGEKGGALFAHGRPNRVVLDYSADGTRRSIDDSLSRLGIDRIASVWMHDIAQDFHGGAWLSHFETARTGAFRALARLKDEGVIAGWGIGVNRVEPCELLLDLRWRRRRRRRSTAEVASTKVAAARRQLVRSAPRIGPVVNPIA